MTKRKSTRKATAKLPDNEDLSCCIEGDKCSLNACAVIKTHLLKPKNGFFIEGFLEEQEKQLEHLINQCATTGESNSVLVIGPRGSGKTKLLEKVMHTLPKKAKDNLYYVYLSGIIHTDDRSALQDMSRQLELENVIDDRVFGSFADNLAFILDSLKSDSGKSKSIVVILDEFDCFCNHKNQSLLYNLFDITMSQQNPLCVIGLTCRLDVVELLEKRVKSRYSHRSILTFPAYDFSGYLTILRNLILLPNFFDCPIYRQRWQRHMEDLLLNEGVVELLKRHFDMGKSIGGAVKLLCLAVCNLDSTHPFITSEDISDAYHQLHADAKALIMNGLSILELCVVIACKHVLERRLGQPFNFEMMYNEYVTFARRRLAGMQVYSRAVTMKAYEHLLAIELLRPTENATALSKEFKPVSLLLHANQIRETLRDYPECPTEIKNWGDSMFA